MLNTLQLVVPETNAGVSSQSLLDLLKEHPLPLVPLPALVLTPLHSSLKPLRLEQVTDPSVTEGAAFKHLNLIYKLMNKRFYLEFIYLIYSLLF